MTATQAKQNHIDYLFGVINHDPKLLQQHDHIIRLIQQKVYSLNDQSISLKGSLPNNLKLYFECIGYTITITESVNFDWPITRIAW